MESRYSRGVEEKGGLKDRREKGTVSLAVSLRNTIHLIGGGGEALWFWKTRPTVGKKIVGKSLGGKKKKKKTWGGIPNRSSFQATHGAFNPRVKTAQEKEIRKKPIEEARKQGTAIRIFTRQNEPEKKGKPETGKFLKKGKNRGHKKEAPRVEI